MAGKSRKVNSRHEILNYLTTERDRLRSVFHVRKVAVIGSFARDEQTAKSDVDLLLDLEEGTPGIAHIKKELRRELEKQFGRPVELASERYLKPYYRDHIINEAVYAFQG